MITWLSVGHFFATRWHDIVVSARAVAEHQDQVQQVASKVEEITAVAALVPGIGAPALVALEVERVSMFSFGVVCELILLAGGPDEAAKAHPQIHPDLFQQASQLMSQYPQLVSQAKGLLPS